ncbi:MAG: exonuclease domain-containing protein [Anaerolineales bacterium]|nr:exonuclease domain-containing protein [Anaerolineales bacterium]MCX7608974.1 exonuclease domain-containing protein [Anaerolineales bacterium]
MTSIVALDIETTGLDPRNDAVIEIGAIRFRGRRVEGEFSTLVNPNRHIPEFITSLTGIDDVMVRGAPRLTDVLAALTEFIGEAPILGHNIKFDLSFFEKYGLFQYNERIDTYEIASVLLPSAGRYNLGALGRALGIPLPANHRALDDARLTVSVFHLLREHLERLPLELLAEIVRHSEQVEWDGAWPFQQVLWARLRQGEKPRPVSEDQAVGPLFEPPRERRRRELPIQLPEELIPLDPDETAALLDYGGPFANYFEAYEHRPEQVEMLRAVAAALSDGQHLMVEAGTGVGKSFAYLAPAALFALQNNTRVVISTNTINLQDQLIKKDIPDLCAALGLDLRASILKGRSNYLCPRRLDMMRRRGPTTPDELRVLAKVLVWLYENGSGDRHEINLNGAAERDVWLHLSAEDAACTNEMCLERQGGACPFFRARQAAANAHLLVVNHALLLTDAATDNRVLPEYQHVIIDEAHHLEEAATNALSLRVTQSDIERLLREAGGSTSGLFGQLLAETRSVIRPAEFALLAQKVERATGLAWRLQEQTRLFFEALGEFVAFQREGQSNGNYAWQERILPSTRTLPGWDEVETAWSAGAETLSLFLRLTEELHRAAADLYAEGLDALEDILANFSNLYRRLIETQNMINALVFEPAKGYVYWVEFHPNGNRLSLNAAPVSVGPLVEKYLWHEKRSVILTSATLTAHGSFDYMRNTLSADEADELMLGSPFDYQNAALLYIPNDIAEPHTPDYQRQVEQTLIHLCRASGGRALVLFTSYAQLKRTAQAISAPLAKHDIILYEQGEGASANMLLESFKTTERAVLLGTRSFWEGVDVPGEALSVLVIVKLPFAVPTDPLVAARSELYEDPFHEYHLPDAVLRFRQGFGRLIRTASDRGVVVILDRRVLTKSYGRAFIESLPPCTRRVGPLADLPRMAAKWLGV